MFPCFDEPACKATFSITMVVPDGLPAYSNSPVESETLLAGRPARGHIEDRDEDVDSTSSPSWSARSRRPRSSTSTACPCPWSAPGKAHLTRFALEVGAFSLRFFSDYFDIAYPGEKLDLVGVPDFAYGAMENVGCIIFRETLLLVDA